MDINKYQTILDTNYKQLKYYDVIINNHNNNLININNEINELKNNLKIINKKINIIKLYLFFLFILNIYFIIKIINV